MNCLLIDQPTERKSQLVIVDDIDVATLTAQLLTVLRVLRVFYQVGSRLNMECEDVHSMFHGVQTRQFLLESRNLDSIFVTRLLHSFIHSDHFYSASSSPLLLRSA